MKKTVTVRGVEIGAGTPKIVVPIVAGTRDEIMAQALRLTSMRVDIVEWRADYYDDVLDPRKVLETLGALRCTLRGLPLLFTFRTAAEGGEKSIDPDTYTALNTAVARSRDADLVDIEILMGDEIARHNIDAVHAGGALVVGSNHDFEKTPSRGEIVARLRKMQDMGANLPKIAVMPRTTSDLLALLSATSEMSEVYADRPITAIAMAGKGVITRLAGEVFGSALTFGAAGRASAPGQIPVDQLAQVLDILHSAL